MPKDTFVHIVTYKKATYLADCLSALADQSDEILMKEITHNGEVGCDDAKAIADEHGAGFNFFSQNIGFSGAHNFGVRRFLDSSAEFLLILNPDLALADGAIASLREMLLSDDSLGMVCPLLLRADEQLKPLEPQIIDSAGMLFTQTLRHLDRYAERKRDSITLAKEQVSGASGACILMRRSFVEGMLLAGNRFDSDLFRVYPELADGYKDRAPLFDEAFIAYREDAELSLRARCYGWKIGLQPAAIGYHVRTVTPERRSDLSDAINRHGVRNRFLLQFLHWSPHREWHTLIPGFILRNVMVIFAVLIKERSSLSGLRQACSLFRRSWERRKLINGAAKDKGARWV